MGRGGVSVAASNDRDFPGARAMGLRMLPECDWRRRRGGIIVRSPDIVLGVVVVVKGYKIRAARWLVRRSGQRERKKEKRKDRGYI